MEKINVYKKRGNKKYDERRMVTQLEDAIRKRAAENPEFIKTYVPATTKEELSAQFAQYCATDADFSEVSNLAETENVKPRNVDPVEPETETPPSVNTQTFSSGEKPVNPMVKEAPIVRDYVTDGGYSGDKKTEDIRTEFNEPVTFGEGFKIPDTSEDEKGAAGSSNEKDQSKQPKDDKGQQKSAPMNPAFEKMPKDKQQKQTKRFAKAIVNITCDLLEKGFVWYTTKDINEAKLAEYDISGDINLDILLELEGNQETTARQFFRNVELQAKASSVIEKEQREEAADALADVFMEKGIAPTPMQNLMMTGLEIIVPKALDAIAIGAQNRSVLNQLRAATVNVGPRRQPANNYSQPPVEQPAAETEPAVQHKYEDSDPETEDERPEEVPTGLIITTEEDD